MAVKEQVVPRSVLVPKPSDELLHELDPRFFTESFDAVAYMLENLPTDREELDQFLQTEISAVDLARDAVVSKLADDVRANYNSFIQGMNQVQEVDMDLVRAQIHVKNGRRMLASSKNDLIMSSLEIVKTKRKRDRVEQIVYLCSHIEEYFEKEGQMSKSLQNNAFTTAVRFPWVDICLDLRQTLSASQMNDILILRPLQHRIQDFIPELRRQFDKSLRDVAEHFDPSSYKELLQAYITLADHSDNLGFEFSSCRLSDVLSSIPEIIVRCVDDIARSFTEKRFGRTSTRKQKPSHSTNQRKSTPKPEEKDDEVMNAGQALDSIIQCYERLTDLMHTYYLLVQWHRDPFNPLNEDIEYLHRCGIDDDDDDDDDDGEETDDDQEENEQSNANASSNVEEKLRKVSSPRRRSNSVDVPHRSPYSQVLCDTGMTLLRYRKIVWENMQQNMLEVFERLDLTYGYKMEQIVLLCQATTTFIEIGEEFTGAPSSKLKSIVRLKCDQYINVFHEDNLELIRMLVDTENWQRIAASMDGRQDDHELIKLIEKRSGFSLDRRRPAQSTINPIYKRRVFPMFHQVGNPFAVSETCKWDFLESSHWLGQPATSEKEEDPQEVRHIPVGEDDDVYYPPEIVLNSSTLSGFVRLSGVYLQMMQQLPHAAWDIFLMLNKLFEFYVYAVFTSFVLKQDLGAFFTQRPPKATFPWEALRETITRTACSMLLGEIIFQSAHANPKDRVILRRVVRAPLVMEMPSDANLHGLPEKVIACEVVASQIRFFDALEGCVRAYLAERHHCLMDDIYLHNRKVAQQLKDFVFKTIAITLVDAGSILTSISQVAWDIPYLADQHNDYVVQVVQRCGEVWGGLQIFADGSIPSEAREEIWSAMVQMVMETLLTGFTSVPKCSPQGRALMIMDVMAVQNGLDLINHVSNNRVPHGWEHVNKFLRAYYMGKEDLVSWVRDHKDTYSKHQFVNLIKHGIGAQLPKKDLRDLVLEVEHILSSS
ncbi:TPA: hypothetical protein N0F65_005956 [Lagenidium giganteum]|uniref:Exocyst complex component Sec8 n=1 Tax=Lagenidium giganteum TaxID=4803 RepID=A0AAV2ZBS1_9STRA|nr:TPA: hypothetical protein N0F65_005956 [Lagenidium giganteum]